MKKSLQLFPKIKKQFPELQDLSTSRFSTLSRAELFKISKVFRAYLIEKGDKDTLKLLTNYILKTRKDLASILYNIARGVIFK